MGFAVARAAHEAGAEVTLVAGPVSLPSPRGVTRVDVRSAEQMAQAVMASVEQASVFIATAAVADWRVASAAEQKNQKRRQRASASAQFCREPGHPGAGGRLGPCPQRHAFLRGLCS
jgi:phosphopantothenoylcysteine decarboxylase/phosphopantothenate--cysteine ligase